MWVALERNPNTTKTTVSSPNADVQPTVVILAPFNPKQRLLFGRVALGTTKTVELCVRNPDEPDRRVMVNKFPNVEKGFHIDRRHFTVFGNQQEMLAVSWTPKKAGNQRESMGFFVERNFSTQVLLIGEALARRKIPKSKHGSGITSILYPIENVPVHRCPITPERSKESDLKPSSTKLTSTFIVPKLTQTDYATTLTTAAAAARSAASPNFHDLFQLSDIKENSGVSANGSPGKLFNDEFHTSLGRHRTFQLRNPKMISNRENYVDQDAFQRVRIGDDLPPCDLPTATFERRATYVKCPAKNLEDCSSDEQNKTFSDDSLEENKQLNSAVSGCLPDSFLSCVDDASLVFKKPSFPRYCSTQRKDKPLPELEWSVTPLVTARKQLQLGPPSMPTRPTAPAPATGCAFDCNISAVACGMSSSYLPVPKMKKFPVHARRQATIAQPPPDVGEVKKEFTAIKEDNNSCSSVWWLQKGEVYGDWLSYVLTMHKTSRGSEEPCDYDRWLQWGYENFVEMQRAVVVLQAAVRGFQQRRRFLRAKRAALVLQRWYPSASRARRDRQRFLKLRESVVRIQTVFLMFSARKTYVRDRNRVVQCQAVARGFLQRRRLKRVKWAVGIIQQRFRALRAGRAVRQRFLRLKNASLLIQSSYRCWIAKKMYDEDRAKVVKCQATVRGFLQRKTFQDKKTAAIILQRHFRAFKEGRAVREKFHRLKNAAILIQASYRCFIVRRRYIEDRERVVKCQAIVRGFLEKRRFLRLKMAAIVIQRRFVAGAIRGRFLLVRKAAIVIQSFCRGFIARRAYVRDRFKVVKCQAIVRRHLQMRRYRKFRSATVTIQTLFRAKILGRAQRTAFLHLRNAAVMIAARAKGFIQQRRYSRMKMAAIVVQRCWRARKVGLRERRDFVELKAATIIVQKLRRGLQERTIFVKKRMAATRIQAAVRGWMARKSFKELIRSRLRRDQAGEDFNYRRLEDLRCTDAAKVIQRAWRRSVRSKLLIKAAAGAFEEISAEEEKRRWTAATLIQAIWRGHRVRIDVRPQAMSFIRDNLVRANTAATEDQELGNRTRNSLRFLTMRCRNLSTVTRAVTNLEVTTSMSRMSCQQLVNGQGLPALVAIMKNRNRSMPHIEIVNHALLVLINVAKCDATMDALFATEQLLDTVLHLIMVYHEKAKGVFTSCVSLLWILAQDETRRNLMLRHDVGLASKLRDVQATVHRKHELAVQCHRNRHRLGAQQLPFHNLSSLQVQLPAARGSCRVQPDWIMGRRNGRQGDPLDFTDPIVIIDQLIRLLKIPTIP